MSAEIKALKDSVDVMGIILFVVMIVAMKSCYHLGEINDSLKCPAKTEGAK